MKVVLNCITNYGGANLKPGNVVDIPLNVAQRWINRGIAHEYKEVIVIPKSTLKIIETKTKTKRVKKSKKNDKSYTQRTDEL